MRRALSRAWTTFRQPAWIGSPALALALSLLCGIDFYFVADRHSETPAGGLLNFVRDASTGDYCNCSESIASIYDAPEGPRLVSDEDSADELTRLYAEYPDRMYEVYLDSDTLDVGLIAPWWSRSPIRFGVTGWSEAPPSAAVETFARRTLSAKYAAHVPYYNVRFLSDPDPMTGTVFLGNMVWWGIGHDLVFLVTSVFAAANVACLPGYLRRRRTARRRRRCECPKCRYLLVGLPLGAASCPECGEPIPARGV